MLLWCYSTADKWLLMGLISSALFLFEKFLELFFPWLVLVYGWHWTLWYVYVEKFICCKFFIVSDLCKNNCTEIVVLDLNFFRRVESFSTAWLSIALQMVHVKKNGKLFLFLGSNVFCKLANLYFALVRLIKPVIVSRAAWLFCSVWIYVSFAINLRPVGQRM